MLIEDVCTKMVDNSVERLEGTAGGVKIIPSARELEQVYSAAGMEIIELRCLQGFEDLVLE